MVDESEVVIQGMTYMRLSRGALAVKTKAVVWPAEQKAAWPLIASRNLLRYVDLIT